MLEPACHVRLDKVALHSRAWDGGDCLVPPMSAATLGCRGGHPSGLGLAKGLGGPSCAREPACLSREGCF